MALVLDASFALAIALEEAGPHAGAAILDRLARDGAVVPPIWRFEVANGLLVAVRRKRLEASRPVAILSEFNLLNIVVDSSSGDRAWGPAFALADRHRLSLYGASYLEVALRLGAPLASLDRALGRAARSEGVETLVLEKV